MSVLGKYKKQPDEVESYTIDYTDDLTEGDGIVAATVEVTPAGLTVTGINFDLTSLRFWVSGGTATNPPTTYKIEATATTGDGRVLQDEAYITIVDY